MSLKAVMSIRVKQCHWLKNSTSTISNFKASPVLKLKIGSCIKMVQRAVCLSLTTLKVIKILTKWFYTYLAATRSIYLKYWSASNKLRLLNKRTAFPVKLQLRVLRSWASSSSLVDLLRFRTITMFTFRLECSDSTALRFRPTNYPRAWINTRKLSTWRLLSSALKMVLLPMLWTCLILARLKIWGLPLTSFRFKHTQASSVPTLRSITSWTSSERFQPTSTRSPSRNCSTRSRT